MPSAVNVAKDLANYNNQLERSNVALQYSYNKSLAEQDRAWQERMSNSAHQREIKDLKAAGLNPVLSVTGGNGAATGSGSSTQVSKPNVDMSLPGIVMDWATAQLNSATQLQRTAMETANAYGIARLQADAAWQRHINPSGNTFIGQLASAPDLVGRALYGDGDYPWKNQGLVGLVNTLFGSKNKSGNKTTYNGKTIDEIVDAPGHDIDDIISSFDSGKPLDIIENWKGKRNYKPKKGGRRFLVPSASKNFKNGRGSKKKSVSNLLVSYPHFRRCRR